MFDSDEQIWTRRLRVQKEHASDILADEKKDTYVLIIYPWNRIVRTGLLHEHDVFFDPARVHKEVQFHCTALRLLLQSSSSSTLSACTISLRA